MKFKLLLICISMVAVLSISASAQTANQWYSLAVADYNNKIYLKAIEKFNRAIGLRPQPLKYK